MKLKLKGLFLIGALFILLGAYFVMAKYTPQKKTKSPAPPELNSKGFEFKNVWKFSQKSIGFSSPNLTDLNKDGVKDIIIGSGIFEQGEHERPIMAIDGKKGTLLWSFNAYSRIFATPFLIDINGDQIKDVLIGTDHCHKGPSKICPNLYALNGKNGKLLWDLRNINEGSWQGDVPGFNTISKFGDNILFGQSGGGFEPRPPCPPFFGHPKTGKILKEFTPEDKGEVYSIPTLFNHNNKWHALFGTGGEIVKEAFTFMTLKKKSPLVPTRKEKGMDLFSFSSLKRKVYFCNKC